MQEILRYLVNMIPYMVISIPVYIVIRVLIVKKTGKKTNRYHEIGLFVFALFLVGLASQTVIPKIEFGVSGIGIVKGGVHTTNLIPFRVFADTYTEVFVAKHISAFLINFLGNILLFVPIGFAVVLLWRCSKGKAILIGFCISLFIEVCQLFFARGTDIDDLILNTAGTAIGVLLYCLLAKKLKNRFDKFKL